MEWMKDLGPVLDRYANAGSGGAAVPDTVDDDFERMSRTAPPDALSDGLAAAFRSDQTPPFAQMAAQMFGRANPSQRANILNMLLATVGPMVLQQILNKRRTAGAPSQAGTGGGGLSDILGGALGGGRAEGGGRSAGAGGGGGGLGDILGQVFGKDRDHPQVPPDVAEKIDPKDVEDLAREAEQKDPTIIEKMSKTFAEQPGLLKAVGGIALAIALGRMAQRKGTL
jgi:hypothetical protein